MLRGAQHCPALPRAAPAASLTDLGGGNAALARKGPKPWSFSPSSLGGGIGISGPGRGAGGSSHSRDWICPEMPQTLRSSEPPQASPDAGASLGKPWTIFTERGPSVKEQQELKPKSQKAPKLLLSLAQPRLAACAPATAPTPRAFLFSPRLIEVQNLCTESPVETEHIYEFLLTACSAFEFLSPSCDPAPDLPGQRECFHLSQLLLLHHLVKKSSAWSCLSHYRPNYYSSCGSAFPNQNGTLPHPKRTGCILSLCLSCRCTGFIMLEK